MRGSERVELLERFEMRVGQNPGKFVRSVTTAERITVAIVSYIPALAGYYAESLTVLQACLASIREGTQPPFDLLVFDNGSCSEVRDFLTESQKRGEIQYLLLSEANLGKGGAWDFIFSAGLGEIIAYSDSDVLFRPGWLQESLKVLDTYPKVGMVTSRPLRTNLELSEYTTQWAESTPEVKIERGQLIPWEVFVEFDLTLGQTEGEIRQRYQSTEDWLLRYRDVSAYVGASHFQFVARRETLADLFPIRMSRPMGEVRTLDRRVNQAGLLRLCITEPLVEHMGNTLRSEGVLAAQAPSSRSLLRRVSEISLVKRFFLSIYDRIFRWYFAKP